MESDRDYTYEELLQRVFSIMRDKNPDMVDGRGKKFIMRPPQVINTILEIQIGCPYLFIFLTSKTFTLIYTTTTKSSNKRTI